MRWNESSDNEIINAHVYFEKTFEKSFSFFQNNFRIVRAESCKNNMQEHVLRTIYYVMFYVSLKVL